MLAYIKKFIWNDNLIPAILISMVAMTAIAFFCTFRTIEASSQLVTKNLKEDSKGCTWIANPTFVIMKNGKEENYQWAKISIGFCPNGKVVWRKESRK